MFRRPLEFSLLGEDDQISLVNPSFTSKTYSNEINPFDSLTGAIATSDEGRSDEAMSPSSMWSDSVHSGISPASASTAQLVTANVPARRPLVTAHTLPKCKYEPHSTAREPLVAEETIPELSSIEDHAKTFRLKGSFIYATKTRNLPRYQLLREFERDGSVSKLNIRAVLPRETRSCSVSAINTAHGQQIRYDGEETLYSMDFFDMRGRKPGTLPGSIQMTSGKSLWGGQWTRFWHVTKCKAKHDVCDYRGVCEPEKHLLYCVKKGVWEDAEGVVVAREETERQEAWAANRAFVRKASGPDGNGRVLEMTDEAEKDGKKRDLVVACWVMTLWMAEELRWEGN